ncbi:MAG: superoxide dismutase family protein [Sphingomonas sp.]
MKRSQLAMGAAAALTLGACASPQQDARYMAGHYRAQADLRTADGADVGKAAVEEIDGALRVIVDVRGLPPGQHGAHVHMVGKCDAPDFASAGGHWNPGAHQHGSMNPMGPHAGDLPNLVVGADGRGHLEFTLTSGSFAGLLDEDGAAIVIHAKPDDLKTDPSGNSGPRIACGVLGAV